LQLHHSPQESTPTLEFAGQKDWYPKRKELNFQFGDLVYIKSILKAAWYKADDESDDESDEESDDEGMSTLICR